MQRSAHICSVSEFPFSGNIWAVRISNSEFAEELFGGGRISNYGFAPDLFVGCSYFELIWKGSTTEHFHCFREYVWDRTTIEDDHNSSSRRQFETLTSAFCSIFPN